MKNDQQWDPGSILGVSGAYWQSCTLHAAVELEVFGAIGDEGLACNSLAQKLGVSEEGLIRLLNALVAMNLLKRSGTVYTNSEAARSYLSKDSSEYIGHMILHHHHLVESWSRLDESVRSGQALQRDSSHTKEEWRESFLMGMFNNAMFLAPRLVKEFDLKERRHLLDMGGGPGTYAIHFCMNNPNLKATVYDLAATRPFAEKTIELFGLTDRIDFMEGDYVNKDIAGSYDVVWMSHILHAEGPDVCRRLIRKAVSALQPGGMILIHDFILENTLDGPLFPALFSLNMLLMTDCGRSYSEEQVMTMLEEAGVNEIRRHSFRGPTDSSIITGIV